MLRDRLVAHRGLQKHYPENSLLAYQKAIEAGALHIEADVLFSADAQPVLYHDITMSRVSGLEGFVHGLSLDELLQQPAYEPDRLGDQFKSNTITPLSALVELLQQNPTVTAFIEIKRGGIELLGNQKVYQIVTETLTPVLSQCVLISFNDVFIQYAHHQGYSRLGLVVKKHWDELNEGYIAEINPEFIFCNTEKIPADANLDDVESTTVIYEVEDADHAIDWFRRGADMIETFDIRGMIHDLVHRAL